MLAKDEALTELSGLIGLIYEGATDPSLWTTAILPAVADYTGASKCVLYTPLHSPREGGFCFLHNIPQRSLELRMTSFQHEDVWTNTASAQGAFEEGAVVLSTDLVPHQVLIATRFYRDFLAPDDILHAMFCIVFGATSQSSIPVICSLFRGRAAPEFFAEDRKNAQLIIPHLSRSLGVMHRLGGVLLSLAASHAALDRLARGVLLLDSEGHVSFANHAAQDILTSGDGLELSVLDDSSSRSRLRATNRLAHHAITAALDAALSRDPMIVDHFSHGVVVPRNSGKTAYVLEFCSLGNSQEFGANKSNSAIAFLADCEQKISVSPQLLRKLYGLTKAEAKTAVALLDCGSVTELAKFSGASVHTLRTQIKQIYLKLSVDTRGRFVRLMMSLADRQRATATTAHFSRAT